MKSPVFRKTLLAFGLAAGFALGFSYSVSALAKCGGVDTDTDIKPDEGASNVLAPGNGGGTDKAGSTEAQPVPVPS